MTNVYCQYVNIRQDSINDIKYWICVIDHSKKNAVLCRERRRIVRINENKRGGKETLTMAFLSFSNYEKFLGNFQWKNEILNFDF